MANRLYTYRCKSCKTVAVAAFDSRGGKCIRCNICRSPMPFVCSDLASTAEHLELLAKGVTYNPGEPPAELPACDVCGGYASLLYGVRLAGIGRYCSAKCADVGKAKHESELVKEPQ